MRRQLLLLLSLLFGTAAAFAQTKYPFQDPSLPIEKRIDNVLSLLTLDEKINALATKGIDSPHLGIPPLGLGEALSGVVYGAHFNDLANFIPGPGPKPVTLGTTQFPQGVGFGRTWDPELVHKAGAVIGSEARWIYENQKAPAPNLVLFTPNADLARDPRWGRTQETYGEDPFLAGTLAAAMVQGVQGDDPHYWQAASLVKHFMANSNEDNRFASNAVFDDHLMREYYTASFRKAFVEGGARSFMASYNAWNGVPMTVNPLLRSLVENEWHVDGIVSSDAGALGNLVSAHKTSADLEAAVVASIKAGVTVYLTIFEKVKPALQATLDHKLLTEADLDNALRGNLRVTFRLGILNSDLSPFRKLKGTPDPALSDEHKAIARKVGDESIVLLKNLSGFLPLEKGKLKSVAVIGPLADVVLTDMYSGQAPYNITPLAGIKARLEPAAKVTYADGNSKTAAAEAAKSADVAIVVVGNHPTCNKNIEQILGALTGTKGCDDPSEGMEGSDRKSIDLPQEELVKAVYAANPKTVVVLVASSPYAINWTQDNVPAILHTSHSGQEEGNAIADVLFGDYNPSGRLVQTWPRSLQQLPPMMDYNLRHGRTYLYSQQAPLYPFGYGLSYSTFGYSNLRLDQSVLRAGSKMTAKVDVTNQSQRDGDEVVQLYVQHLGSSVDRPLKELKGFRRVTIGAGKTMTVEIPLEVDSLSWWNPPAERWVLEADRVRVLVGGSSAELPVSQEVQVGKAAASFSKPPRAILDKPLHPEYTAEARAAGVQGSVILFLEVSPAGEIQTAHVIQSLGYGLDEKAIQAVRSAGYKPTAVTASSSAFPKILQTAEVRFQMDPPGGWQIRRLGYSLVSESGDKPGRQVKPTLSQYVSPPSDACPAEPITVFAKFKITKKGKTQLLDQPSTRQTSAALAAIASWKFMPGSVNGAARESTATVELRCQPAAPTPTMPSPSAGDAPSRIGGGVTAPALTYKLEPEYSEEARQAKYQGTVVIEIVVNEEGRAVGLSILRPLGKGLDEKAAEAVTQWHFRPGMKDGKPVATLAQVEVNFRLLDNPR